MDSLLNVSRRSLVKWGLVSAGLPAFSGLLGPALRAQDASSEAGNKGEVGGRPRRSCFPRMDCLVAASSRFASPRRFIQAIPTSSKWRSG